MGWQGLLILVSIATAIIIMYLWGSLRRMLRWRHREEIRRARDLFFLRREWLEARFLTVAEESGIPRGLVRSDCDFENEVTFARDRQNRQLRALVGVTISFEAVEGGGMEDVEAVGNLRAATAVFRFGHGEWQTDGRAVFNLNPDETIRHFGHELELVLPDG
jgi:hypothetical protein